MNTPIIADNGRMVGRKWLCTCGSEVEAWGVLGHDQDCASCGRLFNCFGQELAPPSQWEKDDPMDDWNYVGSRHHY